ncbi:MAG: microcyclamide/patellamide family RiPP [Oscillatoriales cyanobacterium]|nr:MAG: microcyclamide/patellamide family RiPP [Oscillatoriales cyanobacterium]TAH20350.1 MAG: microcyclamide/patellamide family RiPP [Oscillatoriales cyanobacterium]
MNKKNLNPKQQKPVARVSINKSAIEGLSEETLTLGWSGAAAEIAPSMTAGPFCAPPFAGDDAE